jgi:hypothetical protein
MGKLTDPGRFLWAVNGRLLVPKDVLDEAIGRMVEPGWFFRAEVVDDRIVIQELPSDSGSDDALVVDDWMSIVIPTALVYELPREDGLPPLAYDCRIEDHAIVISYHGPHPGKAIGHMDMAELWNWLYEHPAYVMPHDEIVDFWHALACDTLETDDADGGVDVATFLGPAKFCFAHVRPRGCA